MRHLFSNLNKQLGLLIPIHTKPAAAQTRCTLTQSQREHSKTDIVFLFHIVATVDQAFESCE